MKKMIDARELFGATIAGRMKGPQFLRLFPVPGMNEQRLYRLLSGREIATEAECRAVAKAIGGTAQEVAKMFASCALRRAKGSGQ